MKIAIISGSVRIGRKSHVVALELQKRFMKSGYLQTEIVDLAAYNLPILEERYSMHPNLPAGLKEMQQVLDSADALVFLSPEYHGSYSGVLKNAVDYFWKEFQKKPIGVVSVSTGKFGGINASTEMQQLVLSMGGYPMPFKLLVPGVQFAFNEAGDLTDEALGKGMDKFVSELTWLTEAIMHRKQLDAAKAVQV